MSIKRKGVKKSTRTKDHQEKLTCNAKNWEILFPNGEIKIINNLRKFAKENNLCEFALRSVAYGIQNRKQHKGYKVKLLYA